MDLVILNHGQVIRTTSELAPPFPYFQTMPTGEHWASKDLTCIGSESNRTVTWMVPKATDNDRRHLSPCYDEYRGPRSDLCQSDGISNNNNSKCNTKAESQELL
ncbi:hypothetical protein TNCV_1734171 [Trichonephila clavipes]|nr:hypothetical protein TNCV_1734171 [Trichonephila clavipes]